MKELSKVLLAFGGNEAGMWGEPADALKRALENLDRHGVTLAKVTPQVITRPLGLAAQPDFVNAVAVGETALDAEGLLTLIKRLEWMAGRRPGPRWGPRPLDIDILDFAGQVAGWDQRHDPMQPAHLVLPHPELHRRAFVLAPLAEIAPDWRHPVLGLSAREMLAALASGA